MKLDRTSIIALILCVLAYVGWAQYMKHKYPLPPAPVTAISTPSQPVPTAAATIQPAPTPSEDVPRYKDLSPEELTISTDLLVYRFNQELGGLSSVVLKDYQNDERSGAMELISHPPLLLQGIVNETQATGLRGFQAELLSWEPSDGLRTKGRRWRVRMF